MLIDYMHTHSSPAVAQQQQTRWLAEDADRIYIYTPYSKMFIYYMHTHSSSTVAQQDGSLRMRTGRLGRTLG